MKTTVKLILVILVLTHVLACKQKIETPKQIGQHVFVMFQNFNDYNKTDFVNEFISLKDYETLSYKAGIVCPDKGNKCSKIIKDFENQELNNQMFDSIKKISSFVEMDWEHIKYNKFTYEFNDQYNIVLSGTLEFTYDGKTFNVDLYAAKIADDFKLIGIKHLDFV